MKILMIEDNESVCEMMGMFFENEKYDATFHQDGKEGYEAYKAEPSVWDIVILDLNLPSSQLLLSALEDSGSYYNLPSASLKLNLQYFPT